MAPVKKPAAAAKTLVSFGSLNAYSAGGGLPEGFYRMTFDVRMHQAVDRKTGQPFPGKRGEPRLGVMVTAEPITRELEVVEGAEAKEQFYGLGSKSHESFQPDPDTGKSLVAIPGAAGTTLFNSTNWFYFLKSLYDCGMPEGYFDNDLSVLDGICVHTTNMPEPEERKSFRASQAKTGEVEEEQRQGPSTIPVVCEVLDGGKPWEEGQSKSAPKPAAKAAAKAAAAPVEEGTDEDTLKELAETAIATLLEANPNGLLRVKMKTEVFKLMEKASDNETATEAQNKFILSDSNLALLLGGNGYKLQGPKIVPA